MDQLAKLKLFAKVVETNSFSRAASELNMARTTASKAIAELEQDLKTSLLNRTTRHISPTEAGAEYYSRIQSILSDLQEADEAVQSLTGSAHGSLRINMPLSFGLNHMGQPLSDFMALHPNLRLETHLTDRFVDPVQEGYDLTLRIADLEDTTLISRKLATMERAICASPGYLQRNTTPQHPKDLTAHDCLHYGNLTKGTLWPLQSGTESHNVRINGSLCSNNAELLRIAALNSRGIVILPTFLIKQDLANGTLLRLLPTYAPPALALYALYAPTKHQSTKLRLLIDHLANHFSDF